MANFINQALSGLQSATPSAAATNQTMALTSQLLDRGISGLTDTVNRVGEAKKQAAINQIITNTDVSDPFAAHSALFGEISKIPGVTASEALGLSTAAVNNSMQKQQWQNKLDQQMWDRGIDYIKATKTTPKGYGAITDDFGTTYIYNKDTGKHEPIVNANAGKGNVSPKNIVLKSVDVTVPGGGTKTVTKAVNKTTGNIVEDGVDTGVKLEGTKEPTLSQKDKSFLDNYSSATQDIAALDAIFSDERSSGAFGPLDAQTAKVGAMAGTDDGKVYTLFNALRGKMMTSITDQLAGALSDKDMAYLEAQLPSSSDTFAQAQIKWNNFKQRYRQVRQDRLNRLRSSNPQGISDFQKNTVVTGPDGKQYEIVD